LAGFNRSVLQRAFHVPRQQDNPVDRTANDEAFFLVLNQFINIGAGDSTTASGDRPAAVAEE